MVLSALLVSVLATTCTVTAKPFMTATGCGASTSLNSGASCKLTCLKYYAPTVSTLTCTSGTLSTTTYVCTPINRPMFAWRNGQCLGGIAAQISGAGTASSVTVTGAQLTGAGATDRGSYTIGVFRTLSKGTAIEIQWQFTAAASGGGDGFWTYLSTAPMNSASQTKPTIDTTCIFAVEVDMYSDSSNSDPANNHVAVLFGTSESHSVNTFLSNLLTSQAASFATGSAIQMNTLIQPVSNSGSVTITTWVASTIMSRDVITTGTGLTSVYGLCSTRTVVYLNTLSYQHSGTTTGVKSVANLKLCGAERPQTWSKYVLYGKVRKCVSTTSFGNPDLTHIGLWKPLACIGTVPQVPGPPPNIYPSN